MRYVEAAIPAAAGVLVWWFCEARLNALCLLLMAGLMLYQVFCTERRKTKGLDLVTCPWYSSLLSLSPVLATGLITALTIFYDPGNGLLYKLNMLLSERLSMTQKAVNIYGFHLWGKKILMSGNGGSVTGNTKYFYIDSALMQFSIRYGLVMLVLLLVLFWAIGMRAQKQKDLLLLWALALVSLHAMIEPQMIALQYCPLLLALFTDLTEEREERGCHEEA